ncbi:rhomboid family intramembrane serine protease [Aeoliella sp. SH292]|uniref:rhomboid family intramembrane serine protease n=1 Tax=Aeoliella sp. SH292 TaxID=3454464 RepID=UPI003F9731C2
MGINDRDYGRYGNGDQYGYNDQPGFHFGGVQSMTVKIILFTVAVYVVQLLAGPWFTELFANHAGWYREPWRVFELLTAGFLHSVNDLKHIIFNMLVLFFLGRSVEERYGSREYLAIYLVGIVFSSLVWCLAVVIESGARFDGLGPSSLGASGAISAILLLFVINFPNVTLLVFGIFPAKAWIVGAVLIAMDIFGAMGRSPDDNVAYAAHLGGFLFAFLYWKSGIRLTSYLPSKMPSFKRKPPLRVHRPSDNDQRKEDRLDELLGKVATGGQESLTSSEKRELQKLSKYYQDKRR